MRDMACVDLVYVHVNAGADEDLKNTEQSEVLQKMFLHTLGGMGCVYLGCVDADVRKKARSKTDSSVVCPGEGGYSCY